MSRLSLGLLGLAASLLACDPAAVDASIDAPVEARAGELEPRRTAALEPVRVPANPDREPRTYRLLIKFVDAARVRRDADGLVSRAGTELDAVAELVERERLDLTPLLEWPEQRIAAFEQRAAERSGRAQPDFAGIFVVELPPGSDATELARIGNALRAFAPVEATWIETLGVLPPVDLAPPTPSLVDHQDYLLPDPGLDLRAAWNMGLRGADVRLADVEYGWDLEHEELSDAALHPEPGQTPAPPDLAFFDHGTAVIGVTSSPANEFGITGAVPDAWVHTYSEWTLEGGARRTQAVIAAIEASAPGDVVMLELQTGGPDGPDPGPAEYEYSLWLATRAGVDAGVVIVAAAGNGNLDLDGPSFAEYRSRGDSGAIIVGAGSVPSHAPLDFSCYGARVDVQGWGHRVFTLGYGNFALYGDDPRQSYTDSFAGTSSATPTVAAAAVAMQQLAKQVTGAPLSSEQLRTWMIESGVPQGPGVEIGPLPNLRAAAMQLLTSEREPPTLTITAPADGLVVDADMYEAEVVIEAIDDSLLVDEVQLRIGGQLVDVVDDERPFSFSAATFPKGAWEIVAQGRDLWGNLGESEPITIYVGVDPPEASTGELDTGTTSVGGESSGAGSDGSSSSSTAVADESSGGSPSASGGGDDGCGCDARGASGRAGLLWLLLALLPGRRATRRAPRPRRRAP